MAVLFLVNGMALGAWVARIPVTKTALDLSEGTLGLALLGVSVGTVGALLLAGGLVGRRGARTTVAGSVVVLAASLALLPLATGAPSLFLVLVLVGGGLGGMDVAMNAQAVVVEGRYGRSIIVAFHGTWSLGALIGTGFGGLTIAAGWSTGAHLVTAALIVLAGGLAGIAGSRGVDVSARDGAPLVALPRGPLWVLGAIAFTSAIAEGAITDWSGVFLRETVGTTAAVSALGFLAFSMTMAATRFAGDAATTRFGPRRVVRIGGLIATGGMVVALTGVTPVLTILGFAVAGLGLSACIPLSFAAAGRVPGINQGEAVAAVATIGYTGFLAGPPVIGFIAEATSLTVGLGLIAVLVLTLARTGRALRGPADP